MKQRMTRKFIPTALNGSEMTLTLRLDQLESRFSKLRNGLGFFSATMYEWVMASTPICECGVIRSNWLATSKYLLPFIRISWKRIHLDDEASALLSNKLPRHDFQKKM